MTTTCPRCLQDKPANRAYCKVCQTRLALERYYEKRGKPMPMVGPNWKLKHKNKPKRELPEPVCADCGQPRSAKKVYCEPCRSKRRKVRVKAKNRKEKENGHSKAHKFVGMAIECGILVPTACECCGSEKLIDAHHSSYDYPLAVTWLCRPCHMQLHRDFEKSTLLMRKNAL